MVIKESSWKQVRRREAHYHAIINQVRFVQDLRAEGRFCIFGLSFEEHVVDLHSCSVL
jgi:hypothetical protein